MQLEICLAITNVPPISVINNDTAQLFAAPNQFKEHRDYRALNSSLEPAQKTWIHNVNAGENKFLREIRREVIADVENAAFLRVERDMFWTAVRSQRERHHVAGVKMIVDHASNRQIGQDVRVVNEKWIVAEGLGDICNSPGSFEKDWFMAKFDLAIAISRLWEKFGKTLRPMVRVDEKFLHAGIDQVIEGKSDERLLKDRHQRFWQVIGEGPQARAESGAEDKGLRNSFH